MVLLFRFSGNKLPLKRMKRPPPSPVLVAPPPVPPAPPSATLLMTVLRVKYTTPNCKEETASLTRCANERSAVDAGTAGGFVAVERAIVEDRESDNVNRAALAVGGVEVGGIAARATIAAGGVIIPESAALRHEQSIFADKNRAALAASAPAARPGAHAVAAGAADGGVVDESAILERHRIDAGG